MYNSSTNDTSQMKKEDNVNHPSHYTFSKYEVLDVLLEWFPKNPLLWQVAKYIARAEHKNNYFEDLQKARFYLDKEIARYDGINLSKLDSEIVELFHRLWGNSMDATEYNKEQWIEMQQLLNRKGVKV